MNRRKKSNRSAPRGKLSPRQRKRLAEKRRAESLSKLPAKLVRKFRLAFSKFIRLRRALIAVGISPDELMKGDLSEDRLESLVRPLPGRSAWSVHKQMLDSLGLELRSVREDAASIPAAISLLGGMEKYKSIIQDSRDVNNISAEMLSAMTIMFRCMRTSFAYSVIPRLILIRLRKNLSAEGFDRLTDTRADWDFLAEIVGAEPGANQVDIYKHAMKFAGRVSATASISRAAESPQSTGLLESHEDSRAEAGHTIESAATETDPANPNFY